MKDLELVENTRSCCKTHFSVILNEVKDLELIEKTRSCCKTHFSVILNEVKDLELIEKTRFFASLRMTNNEYQGFEIASSQACPI